MPKVTCECCGEQEWHYEGDTSDDRSLRCFSVDLQTNEQRYMCRNRESCLGRAHANLEAANADLRRQRNEARGLADGYFRYIDLNVYPEIEPPPWALRGDSQEETNDA